MRREGAGRAERSRCEGRVRVPAAVVLAALLLVCLIGALGLGPARADDQVVQTSGTSTHVTLAFAGDLLMHTPIGYSCYDSATGRYRFDEVFAPIAPYLSDADCTIVNLETRLAGASRGYQGYPAFNTPDDLAPALRGAGIDALGTANNHSLDMGWDGVVRTLDVLDRNGLRHAGTARSQAERDAPRILDVGGIKVGLLNYTDYLNGIPMPSGRPYAVNVLLIGSVASDIVRARQAGAELVVAFVHWGSEYQRYPSSSQTAAASSLIDLGVDLIVGHHPHVVQPIVRVRGRTGREGYVAYSLGNFVSDQRSRYRDSGLMVWADVVRDSAGTRVTGMRYLPTYVQKTWSGGRTRFRVLPVHPSVTSPSDLGVSSGERWRMDQVWAELTSHVPSAAGVTVYRPRRRVPPGPAVTFNTFTGKDRYETALLISRSAFPDGAPAVCLVTGDDFPDALAAAPLATAHGGPVILTPRRGLTRTVAEELARLAPSKVFVIGLPRRLKDEVTAVLPDAEIETIRGADRYETSALLAEALVAKIGPVERVVFAPGDKFPDALSVAPLAAKKGWPILLTPAAGPLPEASVVAFAGLAGVEPPVVVEPPVSTGDPTSAEVPVSTEPTGSEAPPAREVPSSAEPPGSGVPPAGEVPAGEAPAGTEEPPVVTPPMVDILIVGTYVRPPAAAGDVRRIVGRDRYHTSALVAAYAQTQGLSFSHLALATGQNFPDALVVGPYLAGCDGILLLTFPTGLPSSIGAVLDARRADLRIVDLVGLPAALQPEVEWWLGG